MRKFIRGVKNLIRWFPTIWNDRDFDYYYTIEVLKKKLLFQAEAMKKHSLHENASVSIEQLRTCAVLLHVVQNESYFDDVLLKPDMTEEDVNKATKEHDEARLKAFLILSENIESWWF